MGLEQARLLVGARSWERAEAELGAALAEGDVEAWCLKAQCRLGLGDPAGAALASLRALQQQPTNSWALTLNATAHVERGLWADAQRSAAAAALDPGNLEALHVLGRAQVGARRWKAAEATAARLATLAPDSARAVDLAARLAGGRRQWPEAERLVRQGLATHPHDVELILLLATALERQGRHGEAGQVYATVGRTAPRDQRGRGALAHLGEGWWGRALVVLGGIGLYLMVQGLSRAATATTQSGFDWLLVGPVWPLALVLGIVVGTPVAVVQLRHQFARRHLSDALRAVAVRERRRLMAPWLAVAAAGAAALALLAAVNRDLPGLIGCALGAAVLAGTAWLAAGRPTPRGPQHLSR